MVTSDKFKAQNKVKANIVTLEICFKCTLLRHIQNAVPINFVAVTVGFEQILHYFEVPLL